MHSYIQMQKTRHFHFSEMPGFCLLRRCPNPRRTQKCILETLEKSSGYAILQIAVRQLTSVYFRFLISSADLLPKLGKISIRYILQQFSHCGNILLVSGVVRAIEQFALFFQNNNFCWCVQFGLILRIVNCRQNNLRKHFHL